MFDFKPNLFSVISQLSGNTRILQIFPVVDTSVTQRKMIYNYIHTSSDYPFTLGVNLVTYLENEIQWYFSSGSLINSDEAQSQFNQSNIEYGYYCLG